MKNNKPLLNLTFALLGMGLAVSGCVSKSGNDDIDREELVHRHIVVLDSINTLSPLTVGNGKFALTVDFTGLQSFPEIYESGIPLGTLSEWGWHSYPNPESYTFDESLRKFPFYEREVPFSVQISSPERKRSAVNHFRQNPHRIHLGMIGLDLFHSDGTEVLSDEISAINQSLDPWTGEIHSSFQVDGVPVEVTTYGHQDLDLISSRITSPLIEQGLLRISLHFPYPRGEHSGSGCDWSQAEKHSTKVESESGSARILRQIDSTSYLVQLAWDQPASIVANETHKVYLEPGQGSPDFSFSCLFSQEDIPSTQPDFQATASSSKEGWKQFWLSGGAVDFAGSTDPRAFELERRVVLSQYLTKVQCTGSQPPQETGLTYNSWHGKFHLEMHWWHGVHFPLWGRPQLLERSLGYYQSIESKARETAQRQGFEGIRWPKMTDPWGNDSPSSVGSFLIWQQPHLITFAELCYRNSRDEKVLHKYADLVFKTAEFMASYAHYDSLENRYILGPLLIPAQERFPFQITINPPFELVYWHWGLSTAQLWRERLNLDRDPGWDAVMEGLSPLAQKDGLYLAAESAPDSYENPRYMSDHPMVLGAYGMLPSGHFIDPDIMKNTFDFVWKNWNWEETWGWDFPMTAMAAARLGMPDKAVDALFMDIETNTYLPNGHNYQNQRLRLYLPGNGGLLSAVAMMCAGWEGGPDKDAPGFPDDGSWQVHWEGLKKAL